MSIKTMEKDYNDKEKILFAFLQNFIPIPGKQKLR